MCSRIGSGGTGLEDSEGPEQLGQIDWMFVDELEENSSRGN
jgi:hypothetical protein